MNIVAKPKQNDITVENNGLKIFIAKDIELMIKGITIDFDEHRGFSLQA